MTTVNVKPSNVKSNKDYHYGEMLALLPRVHPRILSDAAKSVAIVMIDATNSTVGIGCREVERSLEYLQINTHKRESTVRALLREIEKSEIFTRIRTGTNVNSVRRTNKWLFSPERLRELAAPTIAESKKVTAEKAPTMGPECQPLADDFSAPCHDEILAPSSDDLLAPSDRRDVGPFPVVFPVVVPVSSTKQASNSAAHVAGFVDSMDDADVVVAPPDQTVRASVSNDHNATKRSATGKRKTSKQTHAEQPPQRQHHFSDEQLNAFVTQFDTAWATTTSNKGQRGHGAKDRSNIAYVARHCAIHASKHELAFDVVYSRLLKSFVSHVKSRNDNQAIIHDPTAYLKRSLGVLTLPTKQPVVVIPQYAPTTSPRVNRWPQGVKPTNANETATATETDAPPNQPNKLDDAAKMALTRENAANCIRLVKGATNNDTTTTTHQKDKQIVPSCAGQVAMAQVLRDIGVKFGAREQRVASVR